MIIKEWYADPADLMQGWVTLTEHRRHTPSRGWHTTGYSVHAMHWSLPTDERPYQPNTVAHSFGERAEALETYVDYVELLGSRTREGAPPLQPQVETMNGLKEVKWVRLSALQDGDCIRDSHGWQVIHSVEHTADGRTRYGLIGVPEGEYRADWPSSQCIERIVS